MKLKWISLKGSERCQEQPEEGGRSEYMKKGEKEGEKAEAGNRPGSNSQVSKESSSL